MVMRVNQETEAYHLLFNKLSSPLRTARVGKLQLQTRGRELLLFQGCEEGGVVGAGMKFLKMISC